MAAEGTAGNSEWIWADCPIVEGEDVRAYEHALIRAVDGVRIGLVIILALAWVMVGGLVTSPWLFSLGLFVGSLLSIWARFEANWESFRGLGRLPAGTAVLAVGDIGWLSAVIIGSGGLTSPFAGLLVVPILYSVALFCRLKTAPMLISGMALIIYVGLAAAAPAAAEIAGGYLVTVIALAFLSYAICQILERERRSNEVMMRELSEGVILLDSNGRIVAANRQIERFTDVPLGCMIGEQASELKQDSRYEALKEILSDVGETEQEFIARETTIYGTDVLDILCTTARLPGLVGERIGYVVVCEDVTAIKSALRAREGGEASLNGDLRSPTAVLKVASSRLGLLADGLREDDHHRVVEALNFDPRAMVSNVAALLNVSSLEDPGLIANVRRTNIRELIRRVRRRMSVRASKRNVTVSEEFPANMPSVYADAPRIEDALQRLCDNALRHSPEGGRVCFHVEVDDDWMHVSVTDSGPGVPMQRQSEIFEKFAQFDSEGADIDGRGVGLGLYIVRQIVDLHDGSVDVENDPEGGATFTMSLPLSKGEHAQKKPDEVTEDAALDPAAAN